MPGLGSGYSFHSLGSSMVDDVCLRKHRYGFVTRQQNKYLVEVEEYQYSVYAIKFYLRNHKNNRSRFEVLTGEQDAFRILSTCLKIITDTLPLKEEPYASFGFMGAPLTKEGGEANNKRFRVYRQIMQNRFSPQSFVHIANSEKNTYVLVNKANREHNLIEKIDTMFSQYYEGL